MPNVLLLCEYATLSGGERSMLATLDGIAAAGSHPIVAAPPQGPLAEELRQRGIDHVPWQVSVWDGISGIGDWGLGIGSYKSELPTWSPLPNPQSPIPNPRARLTAARRPQGPLREELAGLLARVRPDMLHANSLSMGRLSGPVAAASGLPSIAHLRDIVKLSRAAAADLSRHRRLLAVSEAVRAFHAAGGVAAGRIHVLYNGVDLEEFRPRPATGYLHRDLGLPGSSLLAATIGQIGLRKGQDVLARAAAILGDRLPDLHWLIVGQRYSAKSESRRFEAELHDAAARLPGRIHFLGYCDDVPRLLAELTILVHPARQEPLGRVLLEAAASGVATVATAVGGTAEIFPPETASALLVPPDDPDALADAVHRMLTEPGLRTRLAAAARRRAEEAFDIRRTIAGLVGHYREVLRTRVS